MSEKDRSKPAAGSPAGAECDLITCVVQRGKADGVVKAAISAGAGGATIFFARGMGVRERLGILGLAIVPEKEVVLVVTPRADTQGVFDAMVAEAEITKPGHGVAFVSPVSRVAGLVPPSVGPSSR